MDGARLGRKILREGREVAVSGVQLYFIAIQTKLR